MVTIIIITIIIGGVSRVFPDSPVMHCWDGLQPLHHPELGVFVGPLSS